MAEQQLVDYINDAKKAGQTDEQTRNLLYKNGWTEAEVGEAFVVVGQAEPQAKPQPQIVEQPKGEAQAQPKFSAQPVQNYIPVERHKSHFLSKFLISLIVIMVLLVAGYFVAGQYINISWNPLKTNPEKVIGKMVNKMKSVKSLQSVMTGEISAVSNMGKVTFNINNKSDVTDANNPKIDSRLVLNVLSSSSTAPIVSADVSVIAVGGVSFVKIGSLKAPNTSFLPIDTTKIEGVWLRIDKDSLKVLSEKGGQQASLANVSSLNGSDLTKKIQDLLTTENMISFVKQFADETVGGQSTYHYAVKIPASKTKDLFNKIVRLQMQQLQASQAGQPATNGSNLLVTNMVESFVKTFVDAVGDINMELWIGKSDYMLYKYSIAKTIDLNKIYSGLGAQIEVKISDINSNFNNPILVQAPASSQKIEDFAAPLMKISIIKSDLSNVSSAAQAIYSADNNYYTLCKNGFLNGGKPLHGPTFTKAVNDIIKQGGRNPICFGGLQDYCVSTQLTDGSWVCTGANGSSKCVGNKCLSGVGTTRCISAKTVCK